MATPHRTLEQFDRVLAACREVFANKLADYGPSWRVMRPASVTDQMFIKAKRIRSLQDKGEQASRVDEGIMPEFAALVNYGIIALIQLKLGAADREDISTERALALYDGLAATTRALMEAKNHDYDEAWRDMRQCSFADIILTKLHRIRKIESHGGLTSVSEGVDANYQDIINYAIFALIQHDEAGE